MSGAAFGLSNSFIKDGSVAPNGKELYAAGIPRLCCFSLVPVVK